MGHVSSSQRVVAVSRISARGMNCIIQVKGLLRITTAYILMCLIIKAWNKFKSESNWKSNHEVFILSYYCWVVCHLKKNVCHLFIKGHPSPEPGKICAALNPGKVAKWENWECNQKLGYICKRGNATLASFIVPAGRLGNNPLTNY